MKQLNRDDSTSKIIRKRYARFLGLKKFKLEKPKKKRPVYWYFLLIVLFLAVLASGFYFYESKTKNTNILMQVLSGKKFLAQASPGASDLSTLPKAEQRKDNTFFSKQDDSDDKSSIIQDKPLSYDSPKIEPHINELESLRHDEKVQKPVISELFFVVFLSTKSKEEAINGAKALSNNGYPSEVILSSTGYYGVVQRQDTYEQARASVKELVASGAVKGKPYIMKGDRVKEFIYKIDSSDSAKKLPASGQAHSDVDSISGAISAFFGEWTNQEFATHGNTRIHIRQEGDDIVVHSWGRCHPTECDWSETTATVSTDGRSLKLIWKKHFAITTQNLVLLSDGTMDLTSHTDFTDKSGREDYDSKALFVKGLAHDWSDNLKKEEASLPEPFQSAEPNYQNPALTIKKQLLYENKELNLIPEMKYGSFGMETKGFMILGSKSACLLNQEGQAVKCVSFALNDLYEVQVVELAKQNTYHFVAAGLWGEPSAAVLDSEGKVRWRYDAKFKAMTKPSVIEVKTSEGKKIVVYERGRGIVFLDFDSGKTLSVKPISRDLRGLFATDIDGDGRKELLGHYDPEGRLILFNSFGEEVASAESGIYHPVVTHSEAPNIVVAPQSRIFLLDGKLKRVIFWDAPGTESLHLVAAEPLGPKDRRNGLVTLFAGRGSWHKTLLLVHSWSGKLLYKETLDDDYRSILPLQDSENVGTSFLVGGRGQVWRYSLNYSQIY